MAQINIKVTDEELRMIDENAQRASLSRSSFLRMVAINSDVEIKRKKPEKYQWKTPIKATFEGGY